MNRAIEVDQCEDMGRSASAANFIDVLNKNEGELQAELLRCLVRQAFDDWHELDELHARLLEEVVDLHRPGGAGGRDAG